MPPVDRGKIAALDWVRVVAMAYIVGFWHLMIYAGGFPGYANGVTERLTVIVLGTFTMLSGYLLGQKPLDRSLAAVGTFYRRRLARVHPPLVAALVVFAACGFIPWAPARRSIVLVTLFDGPSPLTIWYVCMLTLFYLAAPVLLWKGSPAMPLVVGAVFWGLLLAMEASGRFQMEPRLAVYFPAFAAGIWLARRDLTNPAWPAAAAVLASAGIAMTLGLPLGAIEQSVRSTGLALFSAAFVLLAALRWQAWFPAHPLVAKLGYAAFFMYLFHRPIYALAVRIAAPGDPYATLAVLVLVALPAVAIAAYFGQRAYDTMLRGLGL